MLKGVDVSNWQPNFIPSDEDIDFCICKATQGVDFTDAYCDRFIQNCIANNILWGFYHFANGDNPEQEAYFFVEQTKNYFNHGIPILDFEITTNDNDVSWCERFISKVHDLTGVYCMLYISAYRCPQYEGSWIPEKCGLWVAGYPTARHDWNCGDMPYNIAPWQFAAIWQFTSSLQLNFNGNLDGDVAYMDASAWAKYANCENTGEKPIIHKFSNEEIARQCIAGRWGNGDERKQRLESSGYDYNDVQDWINRYYEIADEVIAGKWGNGWNRKNALDSIGYDYDTVQYIVNAKLKGW